MDIAQLIARNLTALMASYPDRETLEKVAHVSGVGFSTVTRAKNADGNLTVQNLELIAKAFRRSARDLLAPQRTSMGRLPQSPCCRCMSRPSMSASCYRATETRRRKCERY